MKKLLTLLFTAVLAFSLAMPVFAQDQSQSETPKTETGKKMKKEKKAKKEKKEKKEKKSKKEKKADAAPAGDSQ